VDGGCIENVLGSWDDEFLISVVNAMVQGKGNSRCVCAAHKILGQQNPERVLRLPEVYDDDHVFEFPPFVGPYSKGAFFVGMERKNDCYLWSKMVETGEKIGPRLNNNENSYKIQNVKCMGSLECQDTKCPHFVKTNERNSRSWTRDRAGRNEVPFPVGREVPPDSVVCAFCERPPKCIASCLTKMFYITPRADDMYCHKTRVAMHVGNHSHRGMLVHNHHQKTIV
jgi:hypothetical protein